MLRKSDSAGLPRFFFTGFHWSFAVFDGFTILNANPHPRFFKHGIFSGVGPCSARSEKYDIKNIPADRGRCS